MVGLGHVYLAFPWLGRVRACGRCEVGTEHTTFVAIKCVAFLLLPLYPAEVIRVYRCKLCGAEAKRSSNFPIIVVVSSLVVCVAAVLVGAALYWALEVASATLHAKAISVITFLGAFVVALCYAVHLAKKRARADLDTRDPEDRSFLREIENGFLVVTTFSIVVSFLAAYGALPWVWLGEVQSPARLYVSAAFAKLGVILLIGTYLIRKRTTLSIVRASGYCFVVCFFLVWLLSGLSLFTFLTSVLSLLVWVVLSLGVTGMNYWLRMRTGEADQQAGKLDVLLSELRAGELASATKALESLAMMIDHRVLVKRAEDIRASLQMAVVDERLRARFGFMFQFFEDMCRIRAKDAQLLEEGHVLVQRKSLTGRCILMLHEPHLCFRDERPLGSSTTFLSLAEISADPLERFRWDGLWGRAVLAALVLPCACAVFAVYGAPPQPAAWVLYSAPLAFCVIQFVRSSGRTDAFFDKYRTRQLFWLYRARPSRKVCAAFIEKLEASIEPESVEPESVAPESVAPESVDPESVEPESGNPESGNPDTGSTDTGPPD